MKKIFHFIKSNNLSGLENVVINICTMVKGYDYTYVSTSGSINKYLKKFGIKHVIMPHFDPINIYKVIKKYRPDIVQAHDARASVFMAFSALFCKRHHIRMISELHNNDPKMMKWWRLRTILYAIASLVYTDIITVSNNITKDYAYPFLLKNKSKTILNVVNPHRIIGQLNSNSKLKKWDCIFVGRMAYQKNPFKFVKIIYKLRNIKSNIKAIMIGDGKLLIPVKDMVKRLRLTNNIYVAGFRENPYKYIQQSKICLITSRYEGLPMVVLESLIIGTPIISTPLSILKYILGNSNCFALNDNQFVDIIINLLNDNNLYLKKRKIETHKMMCFNNVKTFINKYSKIYDKTD